MQSSSANPYQGQLQAVPFSPITPPEDRASFVANVQRRCPPLELFSQARLPIRVIGVHPDDFAAYAKERGWSCTQDQQERPLWNGTTDKEERSEGAVRGLAQRPALWRMQDQDGEFFVFAVSASREAVCHWASMLDQLVRCGQLMLNVSSGYHLGSSKDYVLRALSETGLVGRISRLTEQSGAKPIVLMGYTGLLEDLLSLDWPPSSKEKFQPYFECSIWEGKGRVPLLALKVLFSLRGNLGAELARQLQAQLGGLIYVTKVLSNYPKSFSACVMPSRFLLHAPEARCVAELEAVVPLLPKLQQRTAQLSTPTTLLPPSLLEEAARRGAPIYGNEVSYLAQGCGSLPFAAICRVGPNDEALRRCATEILQILPNLRQACLIKKVTHVEGRIEQIYGGKLEVLELPLAQAEEHCMGKALTAYVEMKAPPLDLLKGKPIRVLGVAAEDLSAYAERQGWKLEARLWERAAGEGRARWQDFLPPKHGNTERALLHRATDRFGAEFLLLSTMPAKELVLHWGSLLRKQSSLVEAGYHVGSARAYARLCVESSKIRAQLQEHSELERADALLVMGYGELTAQLLTAAGFTCPHAREASFAFRSAGSGLSYCLLTKRLHKPVLILMVDFCYWGELSGALAQSILELNRFDGLLHLAKAGQMAGQTSMAKVYCPRSFSLMQASGERLELEGGSQLFAPTDQLLSGDHISFPSTLLETREAVSRASLAGSVSVDVEGAHLSLAAREAGVAFGALYYASDFVSAQPESQGLSLISASSEHEEHKAHVMESAIRNYLLPALRRC